ncbi:hypothetical protein OW666_02890 [Acinetobacter baumannii]|uniref:hypothetical protein n=1 Tax=Acinetobacter baumannii TaxID=470 RepID=UPI00233F04A3|nr:hypothetical protein [Acinetobacter baumannii]MDC4573586.1 hypothetical protein [Acinetobacter baumannii]MDC4583875.1 hypothetical protein [Acinetobacter baumannii]MDC5308475.1 hypothetical protein [Acinetobacter baumannii]MDC5414325.1 hypothetical protein [Acinetobacter baumannii]MDC5477230.1 hypothetical protein [Acinetobacter baumannii]
MAAATQNTDKTLASTDEQATTKPKNTRNKTNKTTETQDTQAGDEKASDQGDLLNSQGAEDGASQDEGNKPTDLKNCDSDNEESNTQENGNPTESSNKTQQTDIPMAEHQIVENLSGSTISNVDLLVINVTNNGFSTVLEPLSRVAIEAGKTASITCHNQTFKHQVLENIRQLKGLGKNLTVE